MKTVHEFFTNKRMDGTLFVHSWSHSRMVTFARVESTRRRMPEGERQVDGLFESLLAESFGGDVS